MKSLTFRLPPTNRWLKFMLNEVADHGCTHRRVLDDMHMVSTATTTAKEGFLAWNGAKVWYHGVGNWLVSGYAHDGRDADEVVARVLAKMLEDK
jgi:hypothetical protein